VSFVARISETHGRERLAFGDVLGVRMAT
jgi:hypothetical protein